MLLPLMTCRNWVFAFLRLQFRPQHMLHVGRPHNIKKTVAVVVVLVLFRSAKCGKRVREKKRIVQCQSPAIWSVDCMPRGHRHVDACRNAYQQT